MAGNDDIDKEILKALTKKVGKALDQGIDGSYVDSIKDRIVKRTRLGIGVDENGNSYRFPKLSDNYREMRQGKVRFYTDRNGRRVKVVKTRDNTDFVKKPRLANTTTPAKSNLTATGQLLKSLSTVKLRMKGASKWLITVGDRRGRGLHGYPATAGNKDIVRYLKDMGRTFLGLTKSQKNQITREIRQILIKFLK